MRRIGLLFLGLVVLAGMWGLSCSGEDIPVAGATGSTGVSGTTGGTGPVFTGGWAGEPALYITAFCPDKDSSMADGGETWVDIGINNAAGLSALGSWTVKCGTYEHVNTLLTSTEISTWTLANGDVLRVHEDSWSGSTDGSKADNNADLWDFKTASAYSINYQYGIIWIEDGSGNIVDLVSYESDNGTQTYWLEGTADNPLAVLTTAVGGGHWNGDTRAAAFDLGATGSVYARLANWTNDGQTAADWQTATTAIDYTGTAGGETGSTGSTGSTGTTGSTGSTGGTGTVVSGYIVDGKFQPDPGDPYYSYYQSAVGLSGSALLSALQDIIDGHTVLSYDALYTTYLTSDNTSDGKVWDMYSDRDGTGLDRPYTFNHNSDKCGNYSDESDCYNREHSIPQSTFDERSPMVSDAHHVIPSDGKVNGQRSAFPHGNVSSANWTSLNGSKRGTGDNAGYSGTVFQPIPVYQGDFARIYFYFSVRYRNNSNCEDWGAMYAGAALKPWAATVYKAWHTADPVSDKERARNTAIQARQGNRNPFIDYPDLALILF